MRIGFGFEIGFGVGVGVGLGLGLGLGLGGVGVGAAALRAPIYISLDLRISHLEGADLGLEHVDVAAALGHRDRELDLARARSWD